VRSGGSDPHRVLGVGHDASEAEIKRAYRALAKRHHPDGGHGSVTRFLEIQAAYEALDGGPRTGTSAGPGRAPGATPRPGAAWTRRPRPDASRPRDPGETSPGSGDTGHDRGPRPAADASRPRRTAGRRRASLGSTSYDDAEGAFEPGWGGASWYGPSSGTYWTLNPREYADPRKHGPEYQARAARPTDAGPTAARPTDAGPPAAAPAAGPAEPPPGASPAAERPAPAGASVAARILRAWRRGTIRP